MSAAVLTGLSVEERKVRRVLRVLEPRHRRALVADMHKEPVTDLPLLDEARAAFREEWAA